MKPDDTQAGSRSLPCTDGTLTGRHTTMNPTPLMLHCTERDGVTILHLGGASLMNSTSALERRAALLLTQIRRPLIIDLSQIEACDLAGAAALVGAGRAAPPATPVRLAGATSPVQQVLHAAGVPRTVPTFTTIEGAIRADSTELL